MDGTWLARETSALYDAVMEVASTLKAETCGRARAFLFPRARSERFPFGWAIRVRRHAIGRAARGRRRVGAG